MDLICSIPEAKFPHLRSAFLGACGERGTVNAERFIDTVRPFVEPEQKRRPLPRMDPRQSPKRAVSPPAPLSPTSRRLRSVFQHIDYKDAQQVSWEDFSMYLVDAVAKGDDCNSAAQTARLDSYELSHVVLQDPVGRVRLVKYVSQWDRVVRSTAFNGTYGVEIATAATHQTITAGPAQKVAITAIEAVPEHNVVVAANADITASFYRLMQQSNVYSTATLAHERLMTRFELDSSVMCFKWHDKAKVLYSGMQTGHLVPWRLNVERSNVMDRYKILDEERVAVHTLPITSLLAYDHDTIISSSLDRTIASTNLVKGVVLDRLSGHSQGVLSMANSDYANLIVSGGFESCLFAWILTLRDRVKPWKLTDKSNPHRGDVTYLHCPPGTPQVLSADTRGVVKVWDIRRFQCTQTLQPDRFYAAADLAGASVMKTLLVPTAHRPAKSGTAASGASARATEASREDGAIVAKEQHPFCAAYNTISRTLLLTGSRATYHLMSDQPVDLASADDYPVTAAVYNPHMSAFLTAHSRTVKIWDAATGAVSETYPMIAKSEITAACLDHTGRKFFLGTRNGAITGHIFLGGSKYRDFAVEGEAIVDLGYVHIRANRRLLFAAGCHETFVVCEDNETDSKLLSIAQPAHIVKALLQVDFDRAQQAASHVHRRSVRRTGSEALLFAAAGATETAAAEAAAAGGDDVSMLVRSCVMNNNEMHTLLNAGGAFAIDSDLLSKSASTLKRNIGSKPPTAAVDLRSHTTELDACTLQPTNSISP
jgi:WD40 repeat protein